MQRNYKLFLPSALTCIASAYRLCVTENYAHYFFSKVLVVFYLSIRCQYKFVGKDMWLTYWMHADKLHAISKQYILWFLSGTNDQTMVCVLHDVNIESNFYSEKIQLLDASGTITFSYFCSFNRVPWTNVYGIPESYLANIWYGRIIKWQKKQYYRSLCIGAVYLSWLIDKTCDCLHVLWYNTHVLQKYRKKRTRRYFSRLSLIPDVFI